MLFLHVVNRYKIGKKIVKIDLININCIDQSVKIDDTLQRSIGFIDWFRFLSISNERNVCLCAQLKKHFYSRYSY